MYIAGFAELTLDCFDAAPVCAQPLKSIGTKANAARNIRFADLRVLKFVLCMVFSFARRAEVKMRSTWKLVAIFGS